MNLTGISNEYTRIIFQRFKSHDMFFNKDKKRMDCSICLEQFNNKSIICHTPCQHMFHYKCFDNLVRGFMGNWYKCQIVEHLFKALMKIKIRNEFAELEDLYRRREES